MSRRVVVTGIGTVNALGLGAVEFWNNCKAGQSGIATHTVSGDSGSGDPGSGGSGPEGDRLEVTLPMAPVQDFEARATAAGYNLGGPIARTDNFTKYAVVAADEAIADAGIDFSTGLGGRTAAIIGSGIGGQAAMDTAYIGMLRKGRRAHPLTILKTIPNAAASQLSIRYGLKGPAFAVSSACASGAHAIGLCADMIRSGTADAGIAGASEAVLTYGALEAWKAMHILSDDYCRPFSKNRNGLVIGEGAGVLVLEERDAAMARGANIYAEIVGFGMNADGKDMINPSMEGAAAAMRSALDRLKEVDPRKVYINAHGTGTLMNDPTETAAIKSVFGQDASLLAMSSTKSMHGHLLGAAGGVEAIAALLALRDQIVPPTICYEEPDPACDLDVTPNTAKKREINLALSNSFAFGGLNAVLAFSAV